MPISVTLSSRTSSSESNRRSGLQLLHANDAKPGSPTLPSTSSSLTSAARSSSSSVSSSTNEVADGAVFTSHPLPETEDERTSRNKELRRQLLRALGNDNARMQQFITLSADFRQAKLSAAQYFSELMSRFGPLTPGASGSNLFREIVALLPDLNRRRALLEVYQTQNRATPTNEFPALIPQRQNRAAANGQTDQGYIRAVGGRGGWGPSGGRALQEESNFPALPSAPTRRQPAPPREPERAPPPQRGSGRGRGKGRGRNVMFTLG